MRNLWTIQQKIAKKMLWESVAEDEKQLTSGQHMLVQLPQ